MLGICVKTSGMFTFLRVVHTISMFLQNVSSLEFPADTFDRQFMRYSAAFWVTHVDILSQNMIPKRYFFVPKPNRGINTALSIG